MHCSLEVESDRWRHGNRMSGGLLEMSKDKQGIPARIPLHMAFQSEIVSKQLEMKVVPRLSKVHGILPLHYVAAFCSLEISNKLPAAKRFDTAAKENDGRTVVDFVARSYHDDIVGVLSALYKEVGIYDSDPDN